MSGEWDQQLDARRNGEREGFIGANQPIEEVAPDSTASELAAANDEIAQLKQELAEKSNQVPAV